MTNLISAFRDLRTRLQPRFVVQGFTDFSRG